jgi:hypothetical protein
MLLAPAVATGHDGESSLGKARAPLPTASKEANAIGRFDPAFGEPTIGGKVTAEKCITDKHGVTVCKPAAGSVSVLASGKVLYWNALEGTERVQASIVAEYGSVALNDQSRVLDVKAKSWIVPTPSDAGANPDGYENDPLVPGGNGEKNNDGALFCSDLTFLPDGRVLAAGGTAYYADPEVGDTGLGVVELEGLRNARIYDPKTNEWTQTGSMNIGRWYPTLVSLGDGRTFVASGVKKLLKPVYPEQPLESGANVKQTETYDPKTGKWTDNGFAGARSLPLFPRLHLLPNGHVFYNVNGQAFNPFGQAYDEAFWNVAATYDPKTASWKDLGIPGLTDLEGGPTAPLGSDPAQVVPQAISDITNLGVPGGGAKATLPGFRGSTFSVMLPLKPDAKGGYSRAEFLTAGGVLNPGSPGSYVATSDARVTTIDTAGGGEKMSTRPVGDLGQPRWYPSGILLPTGEVLAVSGSDRDAVVGPGVEFPVKQAELYDPTTETWRPLASGDHPRTYHNSAALLPDGSVLVGGHAPISTLYLRNTTVAPGVTAPNDGRDPTFEVYRPPYMFRGARPKIAKAPATVSHGRTFTITVKGDAKKIERLVLVRNGSNTHVIDGDQRNVELKVVSRKGSRIKLAAPPNGNVAPAGPYMLFATAATGEGPVPSVAKQLMIKR